MISKRGILFTLVMAILMLLSLTGTAMAGTTKPGSVPTEETPRQLKCWLVGIK